MNTILLAFFGGVLVGPTVLIVGIIGVKVAVERSQWSGIDEWQLLPVNGDGERTKTGSDNQIENVIEAINDVWVGYDDFGEGGFEYVGWIIEQDVSDMREDDWEEEECVEELADVSINAIRMLIETGYDPETVILNRLENHQEKHPEKLIEKYQQQYTDTTGNQLVNNE